MEYEVEFWGDIVAVFATIVELELEASLWSSPTVLICPSIIRSRFRQHVVSVRQTFTDDSAKVCLPVEYSLTIPGVGM